MMCCEDAYGQPGNVCQSPRPSPAVAADAWVTSMQQTPALLRHHECNLRRSARMCFQDSVDDPGSDQLQIIPRVSTVRHVTGFSRSIVIRCRRMNM